MTAAESLFRTPLHDEHAAAGARLIPFAGFEMPVQYPTGTTAEHAAVRNVAGLFDVSHMGEFFVDGPQALDLVQFVTSNDASALVPGQAQYSMLLRENGTIVDDLLVYRLDEGFMLVVNAANRHKDFDWIARFASRYDATLVDRSDEMALIAFQGPAAAAILAPLVSGVDPDSIAYYHFARAKIAGTEVTLSRTGYTGEDGFEIFLPNEAAVGVWRAILEAGGAQGVVPVGLGARDSLRLEMGYPLYGNDLDDTRSPFEAGLGWVVKLDKGECIASEALRRRKEEGIGEKLVGFVLLERGFPRHGYALARDGVAVGEVTSGTLSPTLGKGIGLGYVSADAAKVGAAIQVVIRGQPLAAEIVRLPFHKSGSIRR